jgi:ankyrin repeat protein
MTKPLFIELVKEYNTYKYEYLHGQKDKSEFNQRFLAAKIEANTRLSTDNNLGINAKDSINQDSALHYAADRGDGYIVGKLIGCGADINIINKLNQTPLAVAVKELNESAFRALLRSNPNIALRDEYGQTPLYVAASMGSDRYVEELLQKITTQQEYIDIPDDNGKTPLYIAAYRKHAGVVKILLSNGASWEEALLYAAKHENYNLDPTFLGSLSYFFELVDHTSYRQSLQIVQ